jgi:malonyl-CoA/methylmalonyl-CoA synthetase
MIDVLRRANLHDKREAIVSNGQTHSYQDLMTAAMAVASELLRDRDDLNEERVAFMVSPGFNYVATLWGIWQAGAVAVPICLSHPAPSITHVLKDTGCKSVVASAAYLIKLRPLCESMKIELIEIPLQQRREDLIRKTLPTIDSERRAMILYTSGTTNLPKGVVTTHQNIEAQISTLVNAWKWSSSDRTLCVLPLHHVHGIINVVCCSLWIGARCEFLEEFDAAAILDCFAEDRINVFMAVPTIYFKLIAAWEGLPQIQQVKVSNSLKAMRLMVSGSAALPISVMDKWEKISGHRLLERYGMTELGMAISNPYDGERRAGFVGEPLEGVRVRLCNEKDEVVMNEPGEIQVSGENVFLEYWQQPEATQKSFTTDGWFKTGDVAVVEEGYFRILGRSSIDIIKSGGYKISALEIEEVLRSHPNVKDCAVVGIDDKEWGEVVAAAIVSNRQQFNLDEIRDWLKEQLPPYRLPRKFLTVDDLPRNAMGKVLKNEVKKLF